MSILYIDLFITLYESKSQPICTTKSSTHTKRRRGSPYRYYSSPCKYILWWHRRSARHLCLYAHQKRITLRIGAEHRDRNHQFQHLLHHLFFYFWYSCISLNWTHTPSNCLNSMAGTYDYWYTCTHQRQELYLSNNLSFGYKNLA